MENKTGTVFCENTEHPVCTKCLREPIWYPKTGPERVPTFCPIGPQKVNPAILTFDLTKKRLSRGTKLLVMGALFDVGSETNGQNTTDH